MGLLNSKKAVFFNFSDIQTNVRWGYFLLLFYLINSIFNFLLTSFQHHSTARGQYSTFPPGRVDGRWWSVHATAPCCRLQQGQTLELLRVCAYGELFLTPGHITAPIFFLLAQMKQRPIHENRQRALGNFQKMLRTAVCMVVPERLRAKDIHYFDHYTCCPPPIFMIVISIVEVLWSSIIMIILS